MSTYKITLPGLEAAANSQGSSLFADWVLPEGIDKEDLTDSILVDAGTFEALYSDIDFLKAAIALWGRKHYRTFEKWITALNIEYNPLENYDRMEQWADTHQGQNSGTKNTTSSSQTAEQEASGNTHTFNNVKDETRAANKSVENQRTAYNAATYQPYEKSIETGGTDNTRTGNESDAATASRNVSGSGTVGEMTTGADSYINNRSGRAHGNIGVVSSQQMLQQELDIAKWNLIQQITDMFILDFTVPIFD